MEFKELQQIWDMQKMQSSLSVNQRALHSFIESQRNQVHHFANLSELALIFVNSAAGTFLLWSNRDDAQPRTFMYILVVWMFGSALHLIFSRMGRLRNDLKFDRSLRGDLNYAISVASYQVRLSQIMRWNSIPLATILLFGVWEGGKSWWLAVFIILLFTLVGFFSGIEHTIYTRRKKNLELLREKLDNDESAESE